LVVEGGVRDWAWCGQPKLTHLGVTSQSRAGGNTFHSPSDSVRNPPEWTRNSRIPADSGRNEPRIPGMNQEWSRNRLEFLELTGNEGQCD